MRGHQIGSGRTGVAQGGASRQRATAFTASSSRLRSDALTTKRPPARANDTPSRDAADVAADDVVSCGPSTSTGSKAGRQLNAVLKPKQWIKLIDRLGEIDNPKVLTEPFHVGVR
jgi:hypothetical protein